MTVKELIDKLKKCPEDADVRVKDGPMVKIILTMTNATSVVVLEKP